MRRFLFFHPWSVTTRSRTFPHRAVSVLTARGLECCKPDASLPASLIFICGFQVCVCVACLFVGSGLFALTACLLTVHLPEQRLKLPLPHLLSLRCLFACKQFQDTQSLQRNNRTKCLKKTSETFFFHVNHICSSFYGDINTICHHHWLSVFVNLFFLFQNKSTCNYFCIHSYMIFKRWNESDRVGTEPGPYLILL